jgi:outer membrane protein assembly factor BamB
MRRLFCHRVLLTVCFVGISMAAWSAAAVETVWTYHPPSGHIASSPAVGDINGDGRAELVVATTGGSIIALDGQARQLWRQDVDAMLTITPTLADVTGDAALELLVVDNDGVVRCLDAATGAPLWEHGLPSRVDWGTTSIVAQDINHDGVIELITGDAEGTVVCLKGSGGLVWSYKGQHGFTRCPAVGDLDGDGFPEIVIGGTKSPLVCLSYAGEELWRIEQDALGSSPVIWDLDGDGRQEIITAIGEALGVVDCRGQILWTHELTKGDNITSRGIDSAISVADANGDGTPEIYAVGLNGLLVCMAPDGTLTWSASVGARARRSPSVADIDGDGTVEILVAGYSRKIHVFDSDGTLQEAIAIGGEANSTATIVDLLGDGRPCVVCSSETGGMTALVWPDSKPDATILWPEYRLNAERTAALAMAAAQPIVAVDAFDIGNCYTGSNAFRVRVANPGRRDLTLELTVAQAGEAPLEGSVSSSDESLDLRVPYSVSGRGPADLTFACTVRDGGKVVIERSDSVYLEPFQKELSDAERQIVELEELLPELVDPAGIDAQIALLESRVPACREKVVLATAMSAKERGALQSALTALAEESRALLEKVRAAAGLRDVCTGPLLACAANPWAPFAGMTEAIEERTPPAALWAKAFHGETESVALNLFNFGGAARTFRVEPSALALEGGEKSVPAKQALVLHEVVSIPTMKQDMSADALPIMNQGSTLMVPAWGARQLWINIDTSTLEPGTWTGTVVLSTVEPESLKLAATLEVTVWDAALPEEQPLRLCHWGYVASSVLKDEPQAALEDQISHGTNVFVASGYAPGAKYDENGDLVGEIDYAKHDAYVRQHASHGIILFCGYGPAAPGGFGSPAHDKAHVAYLRAWVKHLAEMGVGYDGFALYPVDEMGLHEGLVERYFAHAKLARKADPNIQMYTDPAPGVTIEELEMTRDYVDIWCPSTGFTFMPDLAEKFAFMKNSGSTLWFYQCAGEAKQMSPLAYYRGQAWLAWQHGSTGIGYWNYCYGWDDPWFAAPAKNEHMMIYQGNGVVSSKRWEAVRDGIEDYSMFAALREAAQAAAAAGKAPEAVGEAEALLRERIVVVAKCVDADEPGTSPSLTGFDDVRPIADRIWNDVQTVRADMARLLAILSKN